MIERYYDEEMRYLQEAGREFAKAHPDRARYLNIDSVGDRDPYVERLIEGFAFLAARVREKLDDSFPELTEGLMSLMWPAFLEPIPSCTIMQFQPRRGILQESKLIPRDAEVLSGAVGPEKCICRFATAFDVALHPLSLAGVERSSDLKGRETVKFAFQLDRSVAASALDMDSLRLFIRAEPAVAQLIHYYMCRTVVDARLLAADGQLLRTLDAQLAVTAAGTGDNETLLPQETGCLSGYRGLIEYFVFPEKFLFFDLNGLGSARDWLGERNSFVYSVTLNRTFPPNRPFDASVFKLFCAPAVNVFKRDCEPLVHDGTRSETGLIADTSCPRSVQVVRVSSAAAVDKVSGTRREYVPYHSHQQRSDARTGSYAVHHRRHMDGRRRVVLSFAGGDAARSSAETITVSALCTNGSLPREQLGEGDISSPGRGLPDIAVPVNITRPTLACDPPDRSEFLWTFLSHLSASLFTLADPGVLRSLLLQYEWSGLESRRRIIESISGVTTRSLDRMVEGAVIRGVELRVEIAHTGVADEGDMHLFGEALQRYLRHFVTINSFLCLVLVRSPDGLSMEWDSLRGIRWPI